MDDSGQAAPTPPESRAASTLLILLAVLLAVAIMLPNNPAWRLIPGRDSGMFLYTAWRLLEGEVPYVTAWENKPPMIFFINALGLLLGGGTRWGVWLLETAALAGAAALGAGLLRRSFGLLPAAFGTLGWLVAAHLLTKDNYTEQYALPFQFLALTLFVLAERRGRMGWLGFAIGAAGGISFMLRQNLIGVWVAIGVYLLIERGFTRRWRALARDLAPIVLGGLAVILVISAYFAAAGALADYWDAAFRFNFLLADRAPGVSGSPTLVDRVTKITASVTAGWRLIAGSGLAYFATAGWLMGAGALLFARREDPSRHLPADRALVAVAALALPAELLLTSISGRLYDHYFLAWLPAMTVLAAYFAWVLKGHLPLDVQLGPRAKRTVSLTSVGLVGLMIGTSAFPIADQLWQDALFLLNPQRATGEHQIVALLEETTEPDDTVLFWGSEAAYNFIAWRQTPVRYLHQPILYMRGYYSPELMEEVVAGIVARKPALIIDASTNAGVPPLERDGARAELIPLLDFIGANYVREGAMTHWSGEWPVYRYVGGSGEAEGE
jgi:4-amino-4-deoxy-L-arabinose transferase-like glycosyltransferase